jgi:hypothetical protein
MVAIRGSNRFGPSGDPGGLVDDLRGDDLWADVQAADLVPFPVDPPGGWQHGQDGFDLALDVGSDALADGLDFTAGPLQLADGLDIAVDFARLGDAEAAPAMPRRMFAGLDEISTVDPSDGIDGLDEVDDGLAAGAADWGLDFLSLDGEDPPPLSALDAAGDLTWADLAPAVHLADGVVDGVDPDFDLDAPLGPPDLTMFTNFDDRDLAQLDHGDRGDDVVGAPLPMFVLDPLTGLDLDQIEAASAMSQDAARPQFLDEDALFADQYETVVV